MTNKVKPFYICITDDMTPQMVQDAFDKCVDVGAKLDEGCRGVKSKHEYKKQYKPSNFKFFGVNDSFMTYMDVDLEYFTNAQEITLGQLDEWLGIEKEVEWKNGDECEYKDEDDEWSAGGRYVCYDDFASHHVFYATNMTLYHATSDQLRKPETPEQKAERERLEAAYDLYCYAIEDNIIPVSIDEFKGSKLEHPWLRVVDKTGYKKQ